MHSCIMLSMINACQEHGGDTMSECGCHVERQHGVLAMMHVPVRLMQLLHAVVAWLMLLLLLLAIPFTWLVIDGEHVSVRDSCDC